MRFLAALGVGGEYAIVNAAIAELMPARVRGRANAVVMNFWPAGAVLAALMACADHRLTRGRRITETRTVSYRLAHARAQRVAVR